MKNKSTEMYRTRLVVEGRGEFPLDMLRYDSCCPDGETDSYVIANRGRDMMLRQVHLRRFSINGLPTTTARWASFGWTVVREEPVS